MSNAYVVSFILGLLLVSLSNGAADSVAFPKGDAAWTVDFTPSSSGTPPKTGSQKHATKIEVTQVNKIRRVVITWSDQSTTEQWSIPPMPVNFEEDPRNGSVDPNLADSMSELFLKFSMPYETSAFEWANPGTLKEKQPISYQGQQCFHYVGQVSPLPGSVVQKREAWIDSKTLLPVALDTGTSLAVFTFAAKTPDEPLVPPAKFKKEIDYYKLLTGYK